MAIAVAEAIVREAQQDETPGYFKDETLVYPTVNLDRYTESTASIGAVTLEWVQTQLDLHADYVAQRNGKLDEFLLLLDNGAFLSGSAVVEVGNAIVAIERKLQDIEKELRGEEALS